MLDPAPSSHPAGTSRGRVLLADDELPLARSLARVLVGAGYEVITVSDGPSAIDALQQHDFDVILSDIHMPGMSGVDLLRSVREHDLDVPVVLMTADPQLQTATEAVELGALQYLVKPIPVEVLVKSMERASKLRRMARIKRETLRALGHQDAIASDRSALRASFDRVLETMWVAFQPIVGSEGGRMFGYEALLRSDEPTLPHPGAVLNAAERLDRLPELGRRVRHLVADAFEVLPNDALLFVNLHAQDLLDPLLIAPDVPLSKIAPRVVLEVTERAPIDDIKDVRSRVGALRAMGFRIAVDDLGAGYAGLTSFALLEPDFVKFDMSLVRDVHSSPIRQKLIGSMTTLCREMGMRVVAEGIETIEERDAVMQLGCDLLQGYLLGRPGRPFPASLWP
jgi:EAL domain-containing protein (putative c-di-GMP-specific phosphodiesterase class I)/CheY-like chemotaxis protein